MRKLQWGGGGLGEMMFTDLILDIWSWSIGKIIKYQKQEAEKNHPCLGDLIRHAMLNTLIKRELLIEKIQKHDSEAWLQNISLCDLGDFSIIKNLGAEQTSSWWSRRGCGVRDRERTRIRTGRRCNNIKPSFQKIWAPRIIFWKLGRDGNPFSFQLFVWNFHKCGNNFQL